MGFVGAIRCPIGGWSKRFHLYSGFADLLLGLSEDVGRLGSLFWLVIWHNMLFFAGTGLLLCG